MGSSLLGTLAHYLFTHAHYCLNKQRVLTKRQGVKCRPPPAGGCFWGLELAYQRVPGVIKTSVGYTGGHDPLPNYNSVCMGRTGHAEAVQVGPRIIFYYFLRPLEV